MPGAGVQLAADVLHACGLQALDGTQHALAPVAHRVGGAGQEQQGQVLGHPGQKSRVVQAQDAAEHAVVGVERKGKGAALVGQVLVHLGGVTVEPVVGGAALQPLVVAHEGQVGHQLAAVLPAVHGRQRPAGAAGKLHQRFGLVAGAHDDGTAQFLPVFAQVLPGIERAHAVPQQKVRHTGVALLGAQGHGVQVVQHGTVAVRLGKVAVVGLGADGPAVAQVVVADHHDALPGQILRQRLVPVDELHHAVGQLQHRPHFALRLTAERMQGAPGHGGRDSKIGHAAHGRRPPFGSGLQRADLAAAGGADAVPGKLDGVGVHVAAEVAAAGGAVLLEHDGVAIHKDLQLGVPVQMQGGAQLLGQDDAAQRVDAADDPGAFHRYHSPSTFSPYRQAAGTTGKLCQHRLKLVYKKIQPSSMIAGDFDKMSRLVSKTPGLRTKHAPPLTNRSRTGKLRRSYPHFFA